MDYCEKCLLPTTHPSTKFVRGGGKIHLVEDIGAGKKLPAITCQACINYEKNYEIDWESRWNELKYICTNAKKEAKTYNCVVPVSGGKDSTYLVYVMKELMGMNPLLITIADPFTHTDAGVHNLNNLKETFNCDSLVFEMGRETFRKATRYAFEKLGEPLKLIEYAIYGTSVKIATELSIPLIVFGENSDYIYGGSDNDVPYANDQIKNIFNNIDFNFWKDSGIDKEELNFIIPPTKKMPPILFMSYFSWWDNAKHENLARKMGFKSIHHEWDRQGTIESTTQLDSVGYLTHLYLKFCKFGFSRVTDIVSREIRAGRMSKKDGKKLILENDHIFDERSVDSFCSFCGYTIREFWNIVDKWYNRDLFTKNNFGLWELKENRF